MSLKVIGAGLARTGTTSLKIALEKLLGGPCYHMSELLKRPEDVTFWRKAARKEVSDWDELFSDYVAAVDLPASLFWRELMKFYPDALVLLSVRDPQSWLESCSQTVWKAMTGEKPGQTPEGRRDPAQDAGRILSFQQHNARVQAEVPAERLLVWQPQDGWGSLCESLKMPIPYGPFPHANTRNDFWRLSQPGAPRQVINR